MKKIFALMMIFALALCLTACGEQTSVTTTTADTSAATDAPTAEPTAEPTAAPAAVSLTVEEGVKSCLRMTEKMYMHDDGNFYASTPTYTAMMKERAPEGGMPLYIRNTLITTQQGKVYMAGKNLQFFSGENIAYAEAEGGEIAAVTADGRVLMGQTSYPEKVNEVTGLTGVKYVDLYTTGAWFVCVYQDGSVKLVDPYMDFDQLSETGLSVDGWSDIAWAVAGKYDGDPCVIGLKNDGTIVADGAYPEAILNWTNMVYVDFTSKLVWGLKADGSVVAATKEDDQHWIDETLAKLTVPLKAFQMTGLTEYVGLDAQSNFVAPKASSQLGFILTTDLEQKEIPRE